MISLGLEVAGVWALGLVAVIHIQPFVVVRSILCWYVLAVQSKVSVVDYLDVSIPD